MDKPIKTVNENNTTVNIDGRILVIVCLTIFFIMVAIGMMLDGWSKDRIAESCVSNGGEWKIDPDKWATHYICIRPIK